jgi:oligopeptide/dipeptide ABC transporter ATP-binding protein
LRAVDGVSLRVERGQTLCIAGESGCGKSVTALSVMGLLPDAATIAAGTIRVGGVDVLGLTPQRRRALCGRRLAAGADREARIRELMALVGLAAEHLDRWPHELSGGQRQRIGIARALALQPRVVVLDEPLSALDMSIQSQVINLLVDLQHRLGLSYVFSSHDLSVVEYLCDEVAVMYLGRIVEQAPAALLFAAPRHPYTRALLDAAPDPAPRRERAVRPLGGEVPSLLNPPPGCAFQPRCPIAEPRCRERAPELRPIDTTRLHRGACHLLPEPP